MNTTGTGNECHAAANRTTPVAFPRQNDQLVCQVTSAHGRVNDFDLHLFWVFGIHFITETYKNIHIKVC